MKGILWYVTRKLEGIFDGILMEFHMRISEDKNQIQKSMYIPQFLSSSLYGSVSRGNFPQTTVIISTRDSSYYYYWGILKRDFLMFDI